MFILLARHMVFMRTPVLAMSFMPIVMMGTRMAVVALGVIIIKGGAIMLTKFVMRGVGKPIMRGRELIMRRTIMGAGILVRIVIVVVMGARVFMGRAMMGRREHIIRILVLMMRISMPLFFWVLVLMVRILLLVIGGIVVGIGVRIPSSRTWHAWPPIMARGTGRAGKARGTRRTGGALGSRWRGWRWGRRRGSCRCGGRWTRRTRWRRRTHTFRRALPIDSSDRAWGRDRGTMTSMLMARVILAVLVAVIPVCDTQGGVALRTVSSLVALS
jgi:hypothetical protein